MIRARPMMVERKIRIISPVLLICSSRFLPNADFIGAELDEGFAMSGEELNDDLTRCGQS